MPPRPYMGGESLRVTCLKFYPPLLFAPRPCRGGAGVGSAFFLSPNIFHVPLFSSLISSLTPIPSPRGEGDFVAGRRCV